MSDTVTGYFFGYDGKVLTKEEYDARVAEHQRQQELLQQQRQQDRLDWEKKYPDEPYPYED